MVDLMLSKSLTINASRYEDILIVGSNVVTLTGSPSMRSSLVPVQGRPELSHTAHSDLEVTFIRSM